MRANYALRLAYDRGLPSCGEHSTASLYDALTWPTRYQKRSAFKRGGLEFTSAPFMPIGAVMIVFDVGASNGS